MSQLVDASLGGQFDRLPPHSIEAEMCLIASMMLDKEMIGVALQVVDRDAFYQADHQILFDILIRLYEQNKPVDAIIVREELAKRQLLDEIGGTAYLAQILSSVPSSAHGAHYAGIVREKSLLRQLISASNEVLREAYAPHEKADVILDRAEHKIFDIAQRKISGQVVSLGEVAAEVYEMIEEHERGRRGLETDFHEVDDMLNGLQNGEMIIVAARPSMGKCLAAHAQVVLADGSVKTIEQVCRERDAVVTSLSDDLRFRPAPVGAFIDDGVKPVFEVLTRLGRRVRTTITHPFLTVSGWRKLRELRPGDSVAVPRKLDCFGSQPIGRRRAMLLGYLLGDGGLIGACPRFTNNSQFLRDDFTAAVRGEWPELTVTAEDSGGTRAMTLAVRRDDDVRRSGRTRFALGIADAIRRSGFSRRQVAHRLGVSPATVTNWCAGRCVADDARLERLFAVLGTAAESVAPASVAVLQHNTSHAMSRWLQQIGLRGRRAANKFIAECVFTAPKDEVALVLNRMFATDGWATVLDSGQAQLGFATVSETMARQVQHLLMRFGVVAKLRRRRVRYRDALRIAWQLDVTDAESIRTFLDEIGIFGKEQACERVRGALERRRYQTNCDLIPMEAWHIVERAKGSESWRQLAQRLGFGEGHNFHAHRRALSRDRCLLFAQALDDARLRALATSDVYWDTIVSITYVGDQQVYDLTVPGTHNFVADDVCVHNTAYAMNIVEAVAANHRLPAAIFSLEMSKQQLAQRMLCSRAGVDAQKVRKGLLNAQEHQKLAAVVVELSKAPIWVDDSPGLTILELRAKARRLKLQHDVKLIMIDYMQLMDHPGAESRQQQISEISRGIKAVARELDIPVIALSQLNRQAEGREGHRPRMSDLRESGSIEQDADVIMLLHREDYYRMSEPDFVPDNIAEVIIAKQRNGPTGSVKLTFDNRTTTFRNLAAQIDTF